MPFVCNIFFSTKKSDICYDGDFGSNSDSNSNSIA